MPKQEQGREGMESSSSTSPEEEKQKLPQGGEEKDKRQTGQQKRARQSTGETSSSGTAPSHLLKTVCHERGQESPLKMRRVILERQNAMDNDEDSLQEPTCSLGNLAVTGKNTGAIPKTRLREPPSTSSAILKGNEDGDQSSSCSYPSAAEHSRSEAESPKMSLLKPPAASSEVSPSSPKKKSFLGKVVDQTKAFVKKLSPKRPDSESRSRDSSPKGKSPVKNPSKSEQSSSSGSPASKRTTDSSFDTSLPSTSSSSPNVVKSPRQSKKSPNKWENPGSPSVTKGADSQSGTSPGRLSVLVENREQVPHDGSRSPNQRRSPSLSPGRRYPPMPKCRNCPKGGPCEVGCPRTAESQRRVIEKFHRNSSPRRKSPRKPEREDDSSDTA